MFTFFNTVEVLPTACVDHIRHALRDSGLAVPVVLKGKSGMPGFVALHAWIPLSEPVCRLLPTELVVAENRATELRQMLSRFAREVQDVMILAQRELREATIPGHAEAALSDEVEEDSELLVAAR